MKFTLEQFLYFQPGDGRSPVLYGASPGFSRDRFAYLSGLMTLDPPPGIRAMGLFDAGDDEHLILTQAGRRDDQSILLNGILLPKESLLHSGADILPWLSSRFPKSREIEAYDVNVEGPPSRETWEDMIFVVLDVCRNRIRTVGNVLSPLVYENPLTIVNAPPDTRERLNFIRGLLGLLPAPIRTGITYATHVDQSRASSASIRFAERPTANNEIILDWETGKIGQAVDAGPYIRFVVSQLRLSIDMLLDNLERLAPTAEWRLKTESRADALAWVARRAVMDTAIRDRQPVDWEEVADVLREDRTIDKELLRHYVHHVLGLAISLQEPEATSALLPFIRADEDLDEELSLSLTEAVEEGHTSGVFSVLAHWLTVEPDLSDRWKRLFFGTVVNYLKVLVKAERFDEAANVLEQTYQILLASEALRPGIPRLLKMSISLGHFSPALSQIVWRMAARHAAPSDFYQLLLDIDLIKHMPEPFERAVDFFLPSPPPGRPEEGALVRAIEGLDFDQETMNWLKIQFAQQTISMGRPYLIDVPLIRALIDLTQNARTADQRARLEELAGEAVSAFKSSRHAQYVVAPLNLLLLRWVLVAGKYDVFGSMIRFYQDFLFGKAQDADLGNLLIEVVEGAELTTQQILDAMDALPANRLRPIPLAMIYRAGLVAAGWPKEAAELAHRLALLLFRDPLLIPTIGHDVAMQLLALQVTQGDTEDTIRTAAALVESAPQDAQAGADLFRKMWNWLTWDRDVYESALELLRAYARRMPPGQAEPLAKAFRDMQREFYTIQAALFWRQIIGDQSLELFARDLETAAELFNDIVMAYERRDIPPASRLENDLNAMSGGLVKLERQEVGRLFFTAADAIRKLGERRTRNRPFQKIEDRITRGEELPAAGIDALRWLGGFFAGGEVFEFELRQEAPAHLMGQRSNPMLLKEIRSSSALCERLLDAFTESNSVIDIPAWALNVELQSRWDMIPQEENEHQRIGAALARESQRLAMLLSYLGDRDVGRSRQKSLIIGKNEPRNATESLYWISGYYSERSG
jgi:hypothetical protein